jgi:membrane-associated protease RseP (regulator of RpoE activity)
LDNQSEDGGQTPIDNPRPDTPKQPITASKLLLHGGLMALTLLSCTFTGFLLADTRGLGLGEEPSGAALLSSPSLWIQALSYSLSILAILFAHEMGHYIPARKYGVGVSMPYFIPGFPPFGTFGAFIRMRMEKRVSSKQLFRIGVGGPFAGFVVALPILLIGFWLSEVREVPAEMADASLGDSLLLYAVAKVMYGTLPAGHDIFLHPMGYAGWVGMFVTAFNLVPIGQLDGGHVVFTLFGKSYDRVAIGLVVIMIGLGVTVFPGWLVLVLFLLFMGVRHPNVVEGATLVGKERAVAYGAMFLFAITFVPKPFVTPTLLDWLMGVFTQ